MNRQRRITIEALLVLALIALVALGSFAAPTGQAVLLSGRLLASDHSAHDLVLSVEVEGSCLFAEVSSRGRFSIAVPPGSKAILSFIKPGHLTKEVVIDTESAFGGSRAAKRARKLEFDVVMEPEQKHPGQRFTGPVGSVGFMKGSGALRVRHAPQLTAVEAR